MIYAYCPKCDSTYWMSSSGGYKGIYCYACDDHTAYRVTINNRVTIRNYNRGSVRRADPARIRHIPRP